MEVVEHSIRSSRHTDIKGQQISDHSSVHQIKPANMFRVRGSKNKRITEGKLLICNSSQIFFVCAVIAVSQAEYSVAPGHPIGNTGLSTDAVTSQQSNILRSYGNLGQVATFSKTINTPYSSVSKSDVRVSNPGYAAVAHAPIAYNPYIARPALAHPAYVSPYHTPVVAKGKFKVHKCSYNDCSPVTHLPLQLPWLRVC